MKKKGEIKMATERRGHRQREKKDSEQEKRDRETKKGSDLDKETKKGAGGRVCRETPKQTSKGLENREGEKEKKGP